MRTTYEQMYTYIENLQKQICTALEEVDEQKFITDEWQRPEGGGGRTNVIQNGSVFEKGGVNISGVFGLLPDNIAAHLKVKSMQFKACGLSLVIHPHSPRVPTTHMNVRYFEMENGDHWFGGGIDLTPYYPDEESFGYFHQILQKACEGAIEHSYAQYKKQCDEYFYLPHRQEMRGIGGIFYDYLREDAEKHFGLTQAVGDAFIESYLPIVKKSKDLEYTEADKQFQLVRRGRYVEFNLVYDRGTLVGLKTNGRIESILMSLPKEVNFLYNWQPTEPHHQKMTKYYQAREWL